MTTRRRFTIGVTAGLAAAVAAPLPARAQNEPLVLGQIGLSFYQVVGGVVRLVLERQGVRSVVVEGLHGEIYPRLAAGEVDLLAAAWLPHAHGPLHAAAAASSFELGTLYDDARLFWTVPAHVDAAQMKTIDDLKRPEVAARMDKRIVGIGADSGLMRGAAMIHRDYGLGAAGYEIVTGPAADWIANARRVVASGAWAVVPLWQPQWMMKALPMRVLDEPHGVYRPDRCVLVASNRLRERLPAPALAALARIQLGLDAVTEMDHAVAVGGATPLDAARRWMDANGERVARWFA